jgi:hypothetical protein
MYTVHINTAPGNAYGCSILLAIDSGLSSQAGYAIADIKITSKGWPATDVQRSISLQSFWQICSSLPALLASGQIFQSLAVRNLAYALNGHGLSDAEIRGPVAGLQSSLLKNLDSYLAAKAVSAITAAMRPVYILSIVYGSICLLATLVMKQWLFVKRPIFKP